MRRELVNPYEQYPGFNCFGCSKNNVAGLKLNFVETENGIESEWKPDTRFEGYFGILHGGIQATLLDEIASWIINVKLDTAGVTSKLEIEYVKPVKLDSCKNITLKASIESVEGNNAIIYATLENDQHDICTNARLTYFIYPKEIAKRKLKFAGKNSYYKTNL